MYVLPPPSRYPNGAATTFNTQGMTLPSLETSNVLQRLEGPEYVLQVGEGSYLFRDDLQLGTPPPHPSDAPTPNPNPLATNPTAPTCGVKLSLIIISPRKAQPQFYQLNARKVDSLNNLAPSIKETDKEGRSSLETGNELGGPRLSFENGGSTSTPVFGQGNAMLPAAGGKELLKRRKPKNNIIKSNSSFVSRVIPHDALSKRLSDREASGIFAFANINRAYQWLDLTHGAKAEPLAKILFTKAHILCHDVNPVTKSISHIDVVMGSSAGDIIWYEPMTQKYARLNKNGAINNTPVSYLQWIPGSESLFLAAHTDGTLVVYDKEKEDSPFYEDMVHSDPFGSTASLEHSALNVIKSVNASNQKFNPVACWKVSRHRINQFAFSPDSRHLAVVSDDGHLRIIDYLQEKLTDVYSSYYGEFNCVCWSPDGVYILTGGQDDLVSIWSFPDRRLIARCPGHDSWVTAVAFDPWRCDDRNYRFGSVGDDCKLLLWDFSVGMLHRPRGVSTRHKGSISGHSVALQRHRTESTITADRLRSDSNRTQGYGQDVSGNQASVDHSVEPRARTAQLPPVLSKAVDDHPLCWLGFEEDCIITSCQEGHIRMWDRPKEGVNGSQIALAASRNST